MTNVTHAPDKATSLGRPELVRQLAGALKRGTSALVLGPAGTSDALTEVAAALDGARTRVLRVRPPYNLTSFMQQLAPNGSEEDGSLLDGAYEALAVLKGSYTRIVLLAEDAHLLPKTTLRYIESALRNRPHLSVALAGQPELAAALQQPELGDLRERMTLHLTLAGTRDAATAGPAAVTPGTAAPATPRSRGRAWLVAGGFTVLCGGLIASQVMPVPLHLPSGLASLHIPGLGSWSASDGELRGGTSCSGCAESLGHPGRCGPGAGGLPRQAGDRRRGCQPAGQCRACAAARHGRRRRPGVRGSRAVRRPACGRSDATPGRRSAGDSHGASGSATASGCIGASGPATASDRIRASDCIGADPTANANDPASDSGSAGGHCGAGRGGRGCVPCPPAAGRGRAADGGPARRRVPYGG